MNPKLNSTPDYESKSSLRAIKSSTKNFSKKRNYVKVKDECRKKLIEIIKNDMCTIKMAALKLGINYSNAKSIIKSFKAKLEANKTTGSPITPMVPRCYNESLRDFQEEKIQLIDVRNMGFERLNEPIFNEKDITNETIPVFDFSVYCAMIYKKYCFCPL